MIEQSVREKHNTKIKIAMNLLTEAFSLSSHCPISLFVSTWALGSIGSREPWNRNRKLHWESLVLRVAAVCQQMKMKKPKKQYTSAKVFQSVCIGK